jgi:hypothetical protein
MCNRIFDLKKGPKQVFAQVNSLLPFNAYEWNTCTKKLHPIEGTRKLPYYNKNVFLLPFLIPCILISIRPDYIDELREMFDRLFIWKLGHNSRTKDWAPQYISTTRLLTRPSPYWVIIRGGTLIFFLSLENLWGK